MTISQLIISLLPGGKLPVVPNFADAEVPAASAASSDVFTLANAPTPPISLHLSLNGIRLTAGQDYTLAANTITMDAAITPGTTDVFVADYRF